MVEIPAVNTDMKIIGGNQRVMALLMADRGEEEIDVRYPNRKLTSKEVKEYAIISNTHAGEFDFEVLQLEFADIDITEWGICESTNEEQNNNKGKIKKDTSNMIAIVLTDDEHSQWLNTKEQIGKMQDKNAIFELIKFYNEKNIN